MSGSVLRAAQLFSIFATRSRGVGLLQARYAALDIKVRQLRLRIYPFDDSGHRRCELFSAAKARVPRGRQRA
jgi:hypothetical protein